MVKDRALLIISCAAGVTLAATALGCGSASGLPKRPGEGVPPAVASRHQAGSQEWRAFAAWLRRRAAAGSFSGAILVARNGRPLVEQAYGLANRKHKAANNLATKFNIGSVGKTFTAIAIAQLVEQGKLSLDDPISKYVSGLPAGAANRITIAQLLTHTSGLGDVFMRWHPTTPSPLPLPEPMIRIANEPLLFEPGSQYAYSNSGYVLLGAVIEAVTRQNYYEYVRKHVLEPAAMAHTGWYTLDQFPDMAHDYMQVDKNGNPIPPGPPPPGPGPVPGKPVAVRDAGAALAGNPSGGAYSTVGDLTRFARALMAHKLLSAQMTDTVLTGKVDTGLSPGPPGAPQVSKYGYGFEDDVLNRVRIVGHNGGGPGFEAQLRIYLQLGYTVVILTNQDGANMPVYARANHILAGA